MNQVADRDEFSEWADASLDKPQPFYTRTQTTPITKYEEAAYVFPVSNGSENLGYITASATKAAAPILEYTRAAPPQQNVEDVKQFAKKKGRKTTDRFLYHGGVTYSYEVRGGEAIDLGGRYLKQAPNSAPITNLNFETTTATSKWNILTSDSPSSGTIGTQSVSTSSLPSSIAIDSVPAFRYNYSAGDDVKGDNSYPDYLGNADDPWADYDGCAPFSAAMVIGYWEGMRTTDSWSKINRLIDLLHHHMDTGNDVYTDVDKIAPGIESYSEGDESYSANTNSNFSKSDLKSEIYYARPAMLIMWDAGSPEESGYQEYGNHTVTVSAYEERSDGLYWGVYDSYDDQRHWLSNGNWSDADTTFVKTTN